MTKFDHVRTLLEQALPRFEPRSAGPLTLVPLFGGMPAREYLVAGAALEQGLMEITELDGGHVPQLVAINKATVPVLLVDGEHLVGAMQNRIMNSSALIAPQTKTVLPVSCVEQGRWHYDEGPAFRPSDDIAYARLRSLNKQNVVASVREGRSHDADQGAVWDDVAAKHYEAGVGQSDSGAMGDAYEARRGDVDKMLAAFARPEEGQSGVAACVGGRVVALDCFDRPETLEKLWNRLVSGYAMDALGGQVAEVTQQTVRTFLADAAAGQATEHPGIGLGREVAITGTATVGAALEWESQIVHLALFQSRGRRGGGEFSSPALRRSGS